MQISSASFTRHCQESNGTIVAEAGDTEVVFNAQGVLLSTVAGATGRDGVPGPLTSVDEILESASTFIFTDANGTIEYTRSEVLDL